jgi:hypothetical protein
MTLPISVLIFAMPMAFIAAIVYIVVRIMNHLQLRATVSQHSGPASIDSAALTERLEEVERRLTDVQDVMIALSEKFDRWEQPSSVIDRPGRI